jgi:predicted outer membrane repeat protein
MDICYGGGRPHLIRCTFEDNWAMEGGGLYNRYGILWLEDCTFTRNIACGMGCMDAGYGGGLYSNGSPAGSIVKNCTFIDNIAGCGGGAHFGEIPGGPIREAPPGRGAKVLLTDCTFIGNQATFGGAIHMDTEVLDIKDSVFRENSALFEGGAISNLHSITNLDHCIFLGNSASREGACIYVLGSRSFVQGQEWIKEFVLTVNSCTFAGNLAPTDQAIACKSYNSQDFDSAIISNCILDNGGNQIYNPYGSKITIAYTNLRDETSSLYDPCNAVIWGEGNIDVDPCFVDPGYWADPNDPNKAIDPSEPNVIWIDGDYHLKSQAGRWNPKTQAWVVDDVTSPCIDAGDPASPIGEEPFPNGGRINMGAYGGTAEASKSYFGKPPCETIIAGDINGDCNIDFVDFQILAYHWLEDDSP